MEVKLGYKQTEVGVIPPDWEITRLGRICSMKSGIGITSASIDEFSTYPCFGGNGIRGFTDRFTHSGRFPLIGRQGALCGNIVLAEGKFFASEHAIVVTASTKTDADWLFFVLDRMHLNEFSESSAQPGLSVSKILLLPVVCPRLLEQRAIAGALSDADALIESLEQLLTKKRQIKQGAMQDLLTGKKRLPGFSGKWKVETFGEIFQYYATATNSRSDLLPAGNTFYVHYGDIHTRFHNHLDFSVVKPPRIDRSRCSNATLLKNGDWVMVDASEDHEGVGKAIEIQGLSTSMAAVAGLHTFLLREKKPTFSPGFKGHLGNLKSLHDQFLRVATGMKVFGVSKAALKDIELPVPHPKEQIAIAAILTDMDAEITTLEAKLTKARQIKQGMMQELLTGRIRLI